MLVYSVDKPDLPPWTMPPRFKLDIHYFMTPPGERGAPQLPKDEFWIAADDARRWLDDGALMLVSPLDSENQAEVELTDDQEQWLEWMVENQIERVRIVY